MKRIPLYLLPIPQRPKLILDHPTIHDLLHRTVCKVFAMSQSHGVTQQGSEFTFIIQDNTTSLGIGGAKVAVVDATTFASGSNTSLPNGVATVKVSSPVNTVANITITATGYNEYSQTNVPIQQGQVFQFYLIPAVSGQSPLVQGLVRYVHNLFNPAVGLCAISKNTTGHTGVTFNWMAPCASPGPNLPGFQTYIPFENWKYAVGLWGLDSTDTVAASIFTALENLKTSVGWTPPWNDESTIGFPVPANLQDYNVIFERTPGAHVIPVDSAGKGYIVVQAAAWDCSTQKYKAPASINGVYANLNPNGLDEVAAQCMNWFLRGNLNNAKTVLNKFAASAVSIGNNRVAFAPQGNFGYRGIYLGYYLGCAYSLNYHPVLANGVTEDQIIATATALQSADGGLPNAYSATTQTGSIDEASNAMLCALSPGCISWNQRVAASGVYTVTTQPSLNPVVRPF